MFDRATGCPAARRRAVAAFSALSGVAAALTLLVPVAAAAAAAEPEKLSTGDALPLVVIVVMGFGGLGGFVDGLTTDITYRVNFGSRSVDIGSLGDFLAGSTAALAVLTVANALAPTVQLNDFGTNLDQSIRLIALSVLSGYAGVRLLNPLTRKLVEQISADKAREAAQSVKGRDEELVINIKDGDRRLYRFDAEKLGLLEAGDTARVAELLDDARKSFDIALRIDPLNVEALMGMAKISRRRAELKERAGQNAEAEWGEAILLLDRITANNPRSARAFYNKACYKQLRHKDREPAADALGDLEQAFELEPRLKQRAIADPDFAAIRDDKSFKALIH